MQGIQRWWSNHGFLRFQLKRKGISLAELCRRSLEELVAKEPERQALEGVCRE
jgi:hypothetical protein